MLTRSLLTADVSDFLELEDVRLHYFASPSTSRTAHFLLAYYSGDYHPPVDWSAVYCTPNDANPFLEAFSSINPAKQHAVQHWYAAKKESVSH